MRSVSHYFVIGSCGKGVNNKVDKAENGNCSKYAKGKQPRLGKSQ